MRLLIADKEYEGAIAESGFILKEDENNLEALLLRGRAYYYLADHDVATRFVMWKMMLNSCSILIIFLCYPSYMRAYIQALPERSPPRSRAQRTEKGLLWIEKSTEKE